MLRHLLEWRAQFPHAGASRGWMLVKTRRMRRPCVGEEGKLSTCRRVSSLRHEVTLPAISTGRKLPLPCCRWAE